jgi:predicted negative regulator of RcsB-dependent stress response
MTPTAAAAASRRPTLEERTESLQDWARLNARQLSIAGLIVVALAAVLWLYHYSSTQQVRHADEQLLAPQRSLAAGNIPLAQKDLKQIISRFGGTPAAAQAATLLAETYYQQQKYADGVGVLAKAPRSGASAVFAPGIEGLMGDGYAEQGKYRDAATHYLEAATLARYPGEQMQWKATAARAYASAADTANAVKLWTELAKDDASPQAAEAHLRLGELTARPANKS